MRCPYVHEHMQFRRGNCALALQCHQIYTVVLVHTTCALAHLTRKCWRMTYLTIWLFSHFSINQCLGFASLNSQMCIISIFLHAAEHDWMLIAQRVETSAFVMFLCSFIPFFNLSPLSTCALHLTFLVRLAGCSSLHFRFKAIQNQTRWLFNPMSCHDANSKCKAKKTD